MKRVLWAAGIIVPVMAVIGSLGMTLSNHAANPAVDPNVNSISQTQVEPVLPQVDPVVPVENPPPATDNINLAPVEPATTPTVPEQNTINTSVAPPPASPVNSDVAKPSTSLDTTGTTTIKNKAYEQIAIGPANLMNNVWGAPPEEAYTSGIFLAPDGSFGWYWNRQGPLTKPGQTSVLPIYPSIRIGGNCLERTKSANFPIKLGDAKTLAFNLAYSYPTAPTGTYDLAYDLFLSEASQPDTKPKIAAEVMIWMNATAKQPTKYYKGDFSDGNNTYALYSWTMADGRTYYSFVLTGGSGAGVQIQVNAKKLLDQLNLNPEWLIHGVEFGTEIYSGSGQIKISQFNINLNGNDLLPAANQLH